MGLSARPPHFADLLGSETRPSWLEILADNFLREDHPRRETLAELGARYPLVFHCVGLNLGSADPLDESYLERLKNLVEEFRPLWVSDHLSFCARGALRTPDLLPVPYTPRTLELVAAKIRRLQDVLRIPFLVENVSLYARFKESVWSEEEFLGELAQAASCGILLDVNNLYVNSRNYNFDPSGALARLPRERVGQLHLAGHRDCEDHIIDTHDSAVCGPVWDLLGEVLRKIGPVPLALERDDRIPPFAEMMGEVERARRMYEELG